MKNDLKELIERLKEDYDKKADPKVSVEKSPVVSGLKERKLKYFLR